mmetsp:Transcript_34354/g.75468  ORF Transcript_34354/g.75468 Transcript_34354/m.75468 type:complete len:674 (+) Transcript_34354:309-2330(+)
MEETDMHNHGFGGVSPTSCTSEMLGLEQSQKLTDDAILFAVMGANDDMPQLPDCDVTAGALSAPVAAEVPFDAGRQHSLGLKAEDLLEVVNDAQVLGEVALSMMLDEPSAAVMPQPQVQENHQQSNLASFGHRPPTMQQTMAPPVVDQRALEALLPAQQHIPPAASHIGGAPQAPQGLSPSMSAAPSFTSVPASCSSVPQCGSNFSVQPLSTQGQPGHGDVYVKQLAAQPVRPASCDIMIRPGILREISFFGHTIVPKSCQGAVNFLITDSGCDLLFGDMVAKGFQTAGLKIRKLVLPAATSHDGHTSTEQVKNRHMISDLEDEILHQGASKASCIISLGGGAIGDVAGMLASTIYHGIALVHLTTTTMGALDAAIDTRNGINHAYGRDLIGTHWPATAVVIDPTTFSSLSQRHVLNGLAMALKRGFCQSREHLEMITRPVIDKGAALLRDQTYLEMVCKASIEIKLPTLSHYEQTDYNDMCQYYGHAVGNAIEHLSYAQNQTPVLHGEALAIGMCISAEISLLMGLCSDETVESHYFHLHAVGLPTFVPPGLSARDVVGTMTRDRFRTSKPVMGLCAAVGRLARNGDSFAWEVEEHVLATALERNLARSDVANLVGQAPAVFEQSVRAGHDDAAQRACKAARISAPPAACTHPFAVQQPLPGSMQHYSSGAF